MIHIGTCSWAESTLIKSGEFYPREMKTAEERLRYYASHFEVVELNSSYYAIPDRNNVELWAHRTPEKFIFHVKAYGALTGHGIDPATLPADILATIPSGQKSGKCVYIKDRGALEDIGGRFREALEPLNKCGKLGLMVFQFPPWFRYKSENLDFILFCQAVMGEFRIAVEFRYGDWLSSGHNEEVFLFLRQNGITYITADEPQLGGLATIPFLPEVTTDTAYFRFHGRNRENWLKRGIETSLKYDYLYSDSELGEFSRSVVKAREKAAAVNAMFNNCHGASAVKNAMRLRELLKRESA